MTRPKVVVKRRELMQGINKTHQPKKEDKKGVTLIQKTTCRPKSPETFYPSPERKGESKMTKKYHTFMTMMT